MAAGAGGTAGSGAGGASGSSSGGGGGVTALSGTKAVNSLTMAEADQLCNDTFAYFGTAIPEAIACKWQGLAYAASSSAPTEEKLRSNCSDHETSCQTAGGAMPNVSCNSLPATCTATVAMYSDCIAEEVMGFSQTVMGLPTCDTLTRENVAPVFDAMAPAMGPSCTALTNACPDLYPPTPTGS
jgi:hypothetical protein